jgi:hypothetical protein
VSNNRYRNNSQSYHYHHAMSMWQRNQAHKQSKKSRKRQARRESFTSSQFYLWQMQERQSRCLRVIFLPFYSGKKPTI